MFNLSPPCPLWCWFLGRLQICRASLPSPNFLACTTASYALFILFPSQCFLLTDTPEKSSVRTRKSNAPRPVALSRTSSLIFSSPTCLVLVFHFAIATCSLVLLPRLSLRWSELFEQLQIVSPNSCATLMPLPPRPHWRRCTQSRPSPRISLAGVFRNLIRYFSSLRRSSFKFSVGNVKFRRSLPPVRFPVF